MFETLIRNLRPGPVPAEPRSLQQESVPQLLGVLRAELPWAMDDTMIEDSLNEFWRTSCSLNLPLNKEVQYEALVTLVVLRYGLSSEGPTSDVRPDADAHVHWHELWARVDLMLGYLRRLEHELEPLQSPHPAPGIADKSVMLARLCAMALNSVKRAFLATYEDVPWEEMEYLLVMFIEAYTVFATVAYQVATPRRIASHLRCFKKRVEEYVLVHRAEEDVEVVMKRLKKLPKERTTLLDGVAGSVDVALAELRQNFTMLRDWNSLNEISETIRVTRVALLNQDHGAWMAWGWLALRWGLFVVGERVKYSWLSPNLSPHCAAFLDAMAAPSGVLKKMAAVRDSQEHGEDFNAKTLTMSNMTSAEKNELACELEKLRNATQAAINELCGDLEQAITVVDDAVGFRFRGDTVALTEGNSWGKTDFIINEVIETLSPTKDSARTEFDEINKFGTINKAERMLDLLYLRLHPKIRKSLLWLRSKFRSKHAVLSVDFTFRVILFAYEHIPEAVPKVSCLLQSKSTENIESLLVKLCQNISQPGSCNLKTIIEALVFIIQAFVGTGTKENVDERAWTIFAANGALRELASRWHKQDRIVPSTTPFLPALFGRQLRNYLNHLDEVFKPPLNMWEIFTEASLQNFDPLVLERNGAKPRLRDLRWSRVENERLLHLVELKTDMFRCAREGYLFWLQRLVEDGGDVSARDCQDRTLLHAAAQGGQVHVVRWLLGLGAEAVDPLSRDWEGHTALHVAGTGAVAEALLDAVRWEQGGGSTPLHIASAAGCAEVVVVLLRDLRDLNARSKGFTALDMAVLRGDERVVRLLVAAGACMGDVGVTLKYAGSGPTVRLLLDAIPRISDEHFWLAIKTAAINGHEEAFFVLMEELSARGQPMRGEQLRSALSGAGIGGSKAIALRLLDCWRGLKRKIPYDWCAPALCTSALMGHADLLRTLVDSGADPLCTDAQGSYLTALDAAALIANVDIIDFLVERSGARSSLPKALREALAVAAAFGHLEAVQRLVHHGADIDACSAKGWTPLQTAAVHGHRHVVEWLLHQGASSCPGELVPLSPLLLAVIYGHLSVVKVLVPPLNAGRCKSEKKSALSQRQGVPPGSGKDLDRIGLQSGSFLREERRRKKAEEEAAAQAVITRQREVRLRMLQQRVDFLNFLHTTPLCWATMTSALVVVEYLLDREHELLMPIYSKHKGSRMPRLDTVTVYARNVFDFTALQNGAAHLCSPSVAEALLKRMGDRVWMDLGHKNLHEVRGMAVEALELAAAQSGGGHLVRALCRWVSSCGERLELLGADGLQDIHRRAVAALAKHGAEWHRLIPVLMSLCVVQVTGSREMLLALRVNTVQVMSDYLKEGDENEMAVQLLCQYLSDLGEETVTDHVLLGMLSEAMIITVNGDPEAYGLYYRIMETYFQKRS